jgi:23S rRNA pseudouridine1911/1915/1917 synthase
MTAPRQPTVLFEDDDLVVIAKPAGLVTTRAQTVTEPTVQDWMEKRLAHAGGSVASTTTALDWSSLVPEDFDDQFGTPEEQFAARSGIVHRLDKDTSGVMVLAKNPGAYVALVAAFKGRDVHKTYTCLTHGKFALQQGVVSAPLGRSSKDRTIFSVRAEGRPSETFYSVERVFAGLDEAAVDTLLQATMPDAPDRRQFFRQVARLYQGFSLVSCQPRTGRTHQIRVHMMHKHHPLVGDATYVGKKRAHLDVLWCPRQFLHAAKLELAHPRTGEQLVFEAELPVELERVISLLLPT